MVSIETKVAILYASGLLGASIGGLEVCRVGLWGCEPLRGAWIIELGATPMLAVLSFTPMGKKLLAIACSYVALLLLLLTIWAAHSEGSLTWAAYHVALWGFGTSGAVGFWSYSSFRLDHIMTPPPPVSPPKVTTQTSKPRLFSLKQKIVVLFAGAFAGSLLGGVLIHGNENTTSTWNYEQISFDRLPFLVVTMVFGIASPIVIILSQLALNRTKAIFCSVVIAIYMILASLIYGAFDVLFGYYKLGYYGYWFLGILAALAAVHLQKRVSTSKSIQNTSRTPTLSL